jgi:tetratricopeptide (TPR) repeat protein
MFRQAPCWVLLLLPLSVRGDDVDANWKDLLLKAQRASAARDYAGSEQFYQKALHEAERFGVNDARVVSTLQGLGNVLASQKRYPDADASYRRALSILDLGGESETQAVAEITFRLASVVADEGKPAAAFPLFRKSLVIYEKLTGGQSLQVAAVQCATGEAYKSLRAWADAEAPLSRCAEIREADGGLLNTELADALYSLAIVYEKQGKFAQADPRYKLAEKIRENKLGIMSTELAQVLESHANLLKSMGRDKEALQDLTLAAAIRRGEKKTPAAKAK